MLKLENTALAVAGGLILTMACTDTNDQRVGTAGAQVVQIGDDNLHCTALIAGQHIDAGEVCVYVEGDELVIAYTTSNGWVLGETHAWVGESLADMPQTPNGSPKIGNFPYHSGDITGSTAFSFRVPLSEFGLTGDETSCDPITLYIAAHAVVLRDSDGDGDYDESETAWGNGDPFVDRGTWAMYFSVELTCSGDEEPPGTDCETAFAYGDSLATCFLDIDQDGDGDGDFHRWGWTDGPLAPGTYVWDVYAGAGQCDLNKGTVVGTLTVDYDGSVATASFEMNAPYTMSDAHLYIGNELLPKDARGNFTVAPGQYPQVFDFADAPTSHVFDSVSVSGDAFVVAHTTVCGF